MTNGVAVIRTTRYEYPLKAGGTVQKTRTDYADGSKDFKWPLGTKMADVGLYNQDLLGRLQPDEPWVLAEGEKTADALVARGIVAVSLPGGSKQSDLSALDVLSEHRGNPGYVSPDNDKTGLDLMDRAHNHLKRIHPKVRWVPPVSEDPGGDFADLLADFSADDDADARFAVLARLEAALAGPPGAEAEEKAKAPRIYTDTELAAMDLPPVSEVIPGLFGAGHYLLSGAPKMGKSFLVMSLAYALSQGGAVLGAIHVDARDVLYICLEDGLRRTVTRLRQRAEQFGTSGRLHFAFEWMPLTDGGLDAIDAWLFAHQGGCVFIDTGKRLRQGEDENGKSYYSSDYDFISPITDLSHRYDALIVTVWHDRKMLADDFFDQVNASRGLTAAVDGVASLSRDRGSKEAKLSIGDRDTEDRAFTLRWDDILLGWLLVEQVDVSAGKGNPLTRVLSAIRTLDSDLGVSVEMIQAEMSDLTIGTIRNYLTQLKNQAAITTVTRGRFRPVQEEDAPAE